MAIQITQHGAGYGYIGRGAGMSTETTVLGEPRYRYSLERVWDLDRPLAVWIMLNPSTADGAEDDATIRRVVGFSKVFGMGAVRVLNLYALRSTDPKALDLMYESTGDITEVVGPDNDELIADDLEAMNSVAGLVICAWGSSSAPLKAERTQFIREASFGAWCLGKNADGEPKHPLYLPAATAMDRW